MKLFWEVLGMRNTYTGFALKYVIDNKSGKRYNIGEGRLYKKKDYPKMLLEDRQELFNGRLRYSCYYGIAVEQKPDRIEKKGVFGANRRVYATVNPKTKEREFLSFFGLYKIEGLDVYTNQAVDYLRDKQTGIEYRRGERKVFYNEDQTPFPLAEHTDKYEYIYEDNVDVMQRKERDYLKEISDILFVDKFF